MDTSVIDINKVTSFPFIKSEELVNTFTTSLVKYDIEIGIRPDIILCTKRKIVYGTDAFNEILKLNHIRENIFTALFITANIPPPILQ